MSSDGTSTASRRRKLGRLNHSGSAAPWKTAATSDLAMSKRSTTGQHQNPFLSRSLLFQSLPLSLRQKSRRSKKPRSRSISSRSPSRRRQIWATFQTDHVGLRLLDRLGTDRVMWASDYPHADSTWPESQKAIEENFKDVDRAARRRILCENARDLYRL